MKRTLILMALALMPGAAATQEAALERLQAVLPAELAEQVSERIDVATSSDLPAHPLASLALEGVTKGRSGPEVLAAVDVLLEQLGQARAALQAGGQVPTDGEVEAATVALRMGVDGAAVAEMARLAPSGRSLTVPLMVLGGLAERGLPSDQALAAVRDRMAAGVDDAGLVNDLRDNGMGLGRSTRPAHAGPGANGAHAGFHVPVGGIMVPLGPQGDRPRPGRRPGGE
jgi:hypothetical protein